MADLTSLDGQAGEPLSIGQIQAILAQIDLDLMNLVRDGKLSAAAYALGGAGAPTLDRGANLLALLAARDAYQKLLNEQPVWTTTQAATDSQSRRMPAG